MFYPEDISNQDWLKYYSEHFSTVEVNASFYHLMPAKTFSKWRETTPDNFIFSVKTSRYLTHIKKLNEPKEPWQKFINNAKNLKEKLGPILVQLPPNLKSNPERLEKFLKIAGKKYKIAVEVRNETWYNTDIYAILKKHNAAMVLADNRGEPLFSGREIPLTADFVYIRMHGPTGLYGSKYTDKQLGALAEKIADWRKGRNVYVYFNNDIEGFAAENAFSLRKMVNSQMLNNY